MLRLSWPWLKDVPLAKTAPGPVPHVWLHVQASLAFKTKLPECTQLPRKMMRVRGSHNIERIYASYTHFAHCYDCTNVPVSFLRGRPMPATPRSGAANVMGSDNKKTMSTAMATWERVCRALEEPWGSETSLPSPAAGLRIIILDQSWMRRLHARRSRRQASAAHAKRNWPCRALASSGLPKPGILEPELPSESSQAKHTKRISTSTFFIETD